MRFLAAIFLSCQPVLGLGHQQSRHSSEVVQAILNSDGSVELSAPLRMDSEDVDGIGHTQKPGGDCAGCQPSTDTQPKPRMAAKATLGPLPPPPSPQSALRGPGDRVLVVVYSDSKFYDTRVQWVGCLAIERGVCDHRQRGTA